MAESAVSLVVEKLANLIIEEEILLHDVYDQIILIQKELQWMQSLLKDADAKQERNERAKKWVADVRKAAYDVEDIIDVFIIKVAFQKKHGCMGFFKSILNKRMLLREVGKQIASLQTTIVEISKRSTYNIENISIVGGGEEDTSSSSERMRQLRRSPSHLAADEFVVGQTEEIEILVAELMEEEERRRVISIVGMGGLGKTTLAKKIYNHSKVKDHFSCRAWVSISKEYRRKEILQVIIKNISSLTNEELETLDRMTTDELERKVQELLEGTRYLVVLDDIWSKNAWDSLNKALPDTKNKSRVMLTTRNEDVALHADGQTRPHYLQNLSKDESWELFCRKVFTENNHSSYPSFLEKLGRAIVERCGGLPLALIVLGGLLSRKDRLFSEWERVLQNTRSQKEGHNESIIPAILGFSYNDLPYHLKSCFLHLGLFPEDCEINVTALIQYWIVEGIIPNEGVVEECLNELIDRSLLQVVKDTKGGRAKACRIHNLLRELSISKAKEEILQLEIIDENLDYVPLAKSSRRCAVHSKYGFDRYYSVVVAADFAQQQFTLPLRTLIFFDHTSLNKEQMEFICRRFKLLRVLDMGEIKIKCLPKAIGSLIHLRYLSFEVSGLENEIPPSIGNLKNLQHIQIDSRYGSSRKIPNVIWKLERLRYIFIGTNLSSSHIQFDTLKNLQYLRFMDAEGWMKGGNGCWANLMNVVDLWIHKLDQSDVTALLDSFARLTRLQSLRLGTEYDSNVTFPTPAPLALCPHLLKLNLYGCIEKLTNPEELPLNLTKLTLYNSNLKQDSIVVLGNLPNLRILLLHRKSYMGKELVFIAKGFLQLQVLELRNLDELEKLRVEKGALVMLRELMIYECQRLLMVREELRLMRNLKELDISGMPTKFADSI